LELSTSDGAELRTSDPENTARRKLGGRRRRGPLLACSGIPPDPDASEPLSVGDDSSAMSQQRCNGSVGRCSPAARSSSEATLEVRSAAVAMLGEAKLPVFDRISVGDDSVDT
jgi:hypothetical protein